MRFLKLNLRNTFIHVFFALVTVLGVSLPCGYSMAAAPELRSLSPNPAVVGQVVTISGTGFSKTDKILVDNVFVDPVNVVGDSVITFMVPRETPIRPAGVGVAVKSNGEYSFSLNLKVKKYEEALSKAKIKKKPAPPKKINSKKPINSSDADIDRLADSFAQNKMSAQNTSVSENGNGQMANLISVLQYLVYTLSSKLGK